jgi:hypothetical protein
MSYQKILKEQYLRKKNMAIEKIVNIRVNDNTNVAEKTLSN